MDRRKSLICLGIKEKKSKKIGFDFRAEQTKTAKWNIFLSRCLKTTYVIRRSRTEDVQKGVARLGIRV